MAGYVHLLTISVKHEYFEGVAGPAWEFVPTQACAGLARQYALVVRQNADGMEVWHDGSALPGPLALAYRLRCRDPLFQSYTDWAATPTIGLIGGESGESGSSATISAVYEVNVANEPPPFKRLPDPYCDIAITLTTAELNAQTKPRQYQITFKAAMVKWRYIVSGTADTVAAATGDAGEVVAFDKADPVQSMPQYTTFTSTAAIALRYRSPQRFKLTSGVNDLIQCLPNASINMICNKGTKADPQYVAEIYVHQ